MKRVICFIRPHRLEAVKSAIASVGVTGLSVSDVRGTGNSPESTDLLGGNEGVIALPIRSRVEVIADDEVIDSIVDAILQAAQTGDHGDGKIFIEPVLDAIRIRTEERGSAAV